MCNELYCREIILQEFIGLEILIFELHVSLKVRLA